jgi:tol-pal system protein YbgF
MELSRLRRELHDTRADLEKTKADLSRIEGRMMLLAAGHEEPPAHQAVRAEAPQKRAVPQLPVVRLQGAAKPHEGDDGAQDDGGPPILIKVGPGGADAADRLSVDREVLKHPDPVLGEIPAKNAPAAKAAPKKKPTKAEAQAAKLEYDQALSALREKNDPTQARTMLRTFQGHYPESELLPNAAFWLAECSSAEGKHAQAADEFLKLVEVYPTSFKVPDALLRAGESFVRLKDFSKASDLLKRVKDSYPGSDVATQADKELRELADATSKR